MSVFRLGKSRRCDLSQSSLTRLSRRLATSSSRMLKTGFDGIDKSIPPYYDPRTLLQRSVRVRGDDEQSGHLFSYLSPEQRVPPDHPLRTIRVMTDDALRRLSPRFDAIYATTGRPSIPPEHLLRALVLQVLYSVRSERMVMEQLEYNLLFRWFVGLAMDDAVWRRPPSPRIAIGSWRATSPGPSLQMSSPKLAVDASCPPSISPSTARCWKRGRARRVSNGRTSLATR